VGDLTDQTLEEFLDSVGEDTPAPGGGTSSAITVALAAALVEMAAQIAETAADVAELGVKVAESSSPAVQGDALTGVILAESAAAAAARLVWTNISSGPVFDRARDAADRASKARESGTV
jgi:formiminotetrahydrofolate cyclodeaminase